MGDSVFEAVMSSEEAAGFLGVSVAWVERLVDAGLLSVTEVEGESRLLARSVRAYAEARELSGRGLPE